MRARLRNQPPGEMPMVGGMFFGILGTSWWGGSNNQPHEDGPLHRNSETPNYSRSTRLDDVEGGDMIPSPLGRGFPSRHGWYSTF